MCGIFGFLAPRQPNEHKKTWLEAVSRSLRHRGPDEAGHWIDAPAGIAMFHWRLSIMDLTSAGSQPMHSPCGRYVLIYNGEIYNHLDLRKELEEEGGAFEWRGHSDTETLLAGLRHWGVEATLQNLNGMFAFALWDAKERQLFLARDRMGEKPLYYGRSGDTFLFGSELKALIAHPDWHGEINRDALALYLRYNYVPTPWSIYRGIYKLPPAHYMVIRNGGRDIGEAKCYWDLAAIAKQGVSEASDDVEFLTDELDQLLRDAVGRRMAADVPLGAFLSGGYDSTMVAAQMQAQSDRAIKTFSIGFHAEGYNEAQHAKAVAKHLGTDHTELYVTPEQARAVIPKLPFIYDEPFADSSQIPTYLVSQLAREQVTVSLSGDGGDELFCGYNRYVHGYEAWNKLSSLPRPLRAVLAALLKRAPGEVLDTLQRKLPRRFQVSSLADRLPKLAEVLVHQDGLSFYKSLVSHAQDPTRLMFHSTEPRSFLDAPDDLPDLPGLREQMMYLDMMTYLPDDILTKVDRASMAVSLEARVPLLDHRLVEFAWRVPTHYKCRDGQGKWLLRQVLYRYVPRELMERPKMGFGIPIDQWLRGPLRDWGEALLDEKRLRDEGYFDPALICKIWDEHQSGRRRWHHHLWGVLMFQAWLGEHNQSV